MLDDGVRDGVVDVRAPDGAEVADRGVREVGDGAPHGEGGVGPEDWVVGPLLGCEGADEGVGGGVEV